TADGSVSAADNVTAGGDVAVGGDLTVDWDATIDRVLYVTPEDGIGAIICGNVAQSTFNLDIATEGSLKADDALYVGSSSHSGDVYVKNTSGTTTFQVTGSSGDITTKGDVNFSADKGIDLATNSGGVWSLYGSNVVGSSQLRLSGPNYGEFLLDWANGTIKLGGSDADSVSIPAEVRADSGIVVFENSSGSANAAAVRAENTNAAGIAFTGRVTSSDACTVLINKGTGDIIRGFSGATGGNLVFQVQNSGRVVCSALQITGGGDLAEPFDFADADAVKPGMVVAIDPHNPGKLRLAVKAYDRTVAGVISGANGVRPGVTMQQEGTAASGTLPVALTGRVYCWCDAANGAIEPGDLLTTSDTPGHAMKVTDYDRSRGATIGKAMTSLKEGRGFVLMLVMPQ
ncbi:MAG: hypothetical protein HQ592_11485, partial [Planctomycetes bacterium]|nr:hypothetical protein [Planctomycetota bacterium]